MITQQRERLQNIHLFERKEKVVKKNGSLAYQEARARANIYHFFSTIFLNPPERSFLVQIAKKEFLGGLSSLLCKKEVVEPNEFECFDEDLGSLVQEYMELFAVPTARYTTPFEDVYWGMSIDGRGERGPLLGKRAIAAIRFYREAGAELYETCKELPTHVGIELSFMSYLCEREAWAIRMKDKDNKKFRQLQLKFLKAHLNQWFPQLNRSIQANAKNPFYRSLALITEAFLNQDTASLSGEYDSERPNSSRLTGRLIEKYA